jgi:hypothetical protein
MSLRRFSGSILRRPLGVNSFRTFSSSSQYLIQDEQLLQRLKTKHPRNNIPETIIQKIGRNLHLQKNHPLNIIKTK